MNQLISIQLLRGIAALAVLFVHVKLPIYDVYGWGVLGPYFDSMLGAIGVDIFFVLSGFVICLTCDRDDLPASSFARNRLARVVPVYYLLSIPFVLYFCLLGDWSLSRFFNSFLFLPLLDSDAFTKPFHVYGWTLSFELWFYLVAFFCIRFFSSRQMIRIVPLFFLAMMPLSWLFNHYKWYFLSFMFHPLVGEFALGCLVYQLYRAGRITPLLGGMALLLSALLTVSLAANHDNLGVPEPVLADFWLGLERLLFWGGGQPAYW